MEVQQRQLMEQALDESYRYGLELAETCTRISDLFQQGGKQEGIQLLS